MVTYSAFVFSNEWDTMQPALNAGSMNELHPPWEESFVETRQTNEEMQLCDGLGKCLESGRE